MIGVAKTARNRAALVGLLAALGLSIAGCGKTPQLGSEESLGAADALWTAVTAKDPDLLTKSEQSIKTLHDSARLNDEAFQILQSVITTARDGEWTDARVELKAFVKGQRPVEAKDKG